MVPPASRPEILSARATPKRVKLSIALIDRHAAGRSPRFLINGLGGGRKKVPVSAEKLATNLEHERVLKILASEGRRQLFELLVARKITPTDVYERWEKLGAIEHQEVRAKRVESQLARPVFELWEMHARYVAERSTDKNPDRRLKDDERRAAYGSHVARFLSASWPGVTHIDHERLTVAGVQRYFKKLQKAGTHSGAVEHGTKEKHLAAINDYLAFVNDLLVPAGHAAFVIPRKSVVIKKPSIEQRRARWRKALVMQQAKDFICWVPAGIALVMAKYRAEGGRKGRVPFVGLEGVETALPAFWAMMCMGMETGAGLTLELGDIAHRFKISLHPEGRQWRMKNEERPRDDFKIVATTGVDGCDCEEDGYCAHCDWAWPVIERHLETLTKAPETRVFAPFITLERGTGKESKKVNSSIVRWLEKLIKLYNAEHGTSLCSDHTDHDFRHTFAGFWADRGAFSKGDVLEPRGEQFVKRQMGHGKKSTVARDVYAAAIEEQSVKQQRINAELAALAKAKGEVLDIRRRQKAG